MVLNLEWRRRFLPWRDELPGHFYRPLGSVALEGFVTTDQFTPPDEARQSFIPATRHAHWVSGSMAGSVVHSSCPMRPQASVLFWRPIRGPRASSSSTVLPPVRAIANTPKSLWQRRASPVPAMKS